MIFQFLYMGSRNVRWGPWVITADDKTGSCHTIIVEKMKVHLGYHIEYRGEYNYMHSVSLHQVEIVRSSCSCTAYREINLKFKMPSDQMKTGG